MSQQQAPNTTNDNTVTQNHLCCCWSKSTFWLCAPWSMFWCIYMCVIVCDLFLLCWSQRNISPVPVTLMSVTIVIMGQFLCWSWSLCCRSLLSSLHKLIMPLLSFTASLTLSLHISISHFGIVSGVLENHVFDPVLFYIKTPAAAAAATISRLLSLCTHFTLHL